jgi:hypothetical protein
MPLIDATFIRSGPCTLRLPAGRWVRIPNAAAATLSSRRVQVEAEHPAWGRNLVYIGMADHLGPRLLYAANCIDVDQV